MVNDASLAAVPTLCQECKGLCKTFAVQLSSLVRWTSGLKWLQGMGPLPHPSLDPYPILRVSSLTVTGVPVAELGEEELGPILESEKLVRALKF